MSKSLFFFYEIEYIFDETKFYFYEKIMCSLFYFNFHKKYFSG